MCSVAGRGGYAVPRVPDLNLRDVLYDLLDLDLGNVPNHLGRASVGPQPDFGIGA